MKEISHDDRPRATRSLYAMLFEGLPLEGETGLFIAASTLDVMMTNFLINHANVASHVLFVESNPLARYFMDSWGFDGVVYFKFGLVAFVSLICQVIARSRIVVARRVLYFATALVSAVVAYSAVLLIQSQ
jgi:Domain of unknown function (DUF5658)